MTVFTLLRKPLVKSGARFAVLACGGKDQNYIPCVAAPVYGLYLQPVSNTDRLAHIRLAGKKAPDEHSAHDQCDNDDSDVDSLLDSFGDPFAIDASHILFLTWLFFLSSQGGYPVLPRQATEAVYPWVHSGAKGTVEPSSP